MTASEVTKRMDGNLLVPRVSMSDSPRPHRPITATGRGLQLFFPSLIYIGIGDLVGRKRKFLNSVAYS